MGKNEIRMRRQRMTSRGSDRFRNFGNVMERHEQEVKLKKIIRVFSLFAIILIIVMLIIIVVRIEKHQTKDASTDQPSMIIKS